MIQKPRPLPDPNARWFDPATGRPTVIVYEYLRSLDATVRALADAQNGGA